MFRYPGIVVGRMIAHPVEPDLHPVFMDIIDKSLQILKRTVTAVYSLVIPDTVWRSLGVFHSHLVKRQKMDHIDTQFLDTGKILS